MCAKQNMFSLLDKHKTSHNFIFKQYKGNYQNKGQIQGEKLTFLVTIKKRDNINHDQY